MIYQCTNCIHFNFKNRKCSLDIIFKNNHCFKFKKLIHKYNAQKSVCQSGHTHPSKGESRYCDILRLKKKAGEIKDYEIQINHPLFVNNKKITVMRIDFKIINLDNSWEYHEFRR